MQPFRDLVELLITIPGVSHRTCEVLIAETGGDMTRFPSADHLASWAGMCPGNNESAGKHGAGTTRKGSKWLRATLTECAYAAARTHDTYLAAQFWRLAGRRGKKRAVIAVGHSILVAAYHILDRGQPSTTTSAVTDSSSATPPKPTSDASSLNSNDSDTPSPSNPAAHAA